MAGPVLPDLNTLWQAGINPKTGLPVKFGSTPCATKKKVKKFLSKIFDLHIVKPT